MSERDYLILLSTTLLAETVVIAACTASYYVNMKSNSSDLKMLWRRDERRWSILVIEGVKHFP